MLPLSIPIGCGGLFLHYWSNKIIFLKRNRMPDQTSSLMVMFFANLLPYIALLWSLDSILVFRRLYRDVFYITQIVKLFPSIACIAFAILFILIPVRTMINNCHEN